MVTDDQIPDFREHPSRLEDLLNKTIPYARRVGEGAVIVMLLASVPDVAWAQVGFHPSPMAAVLFFLLPPLLLGLVICGVGYFFYRKRGAMSTSPECRCFTPPFHYTGFNRQSIGIDETNGRFAEVSIERCKRCGQHWLRYFFEISSSFSRSGRWYRGAISREQAKRVTAATAVQILSGLDWHFYGGSSFNTTGIRTTVPLDPDHL